MNFRFLACTLLLLSSFPLAAQLPEFHVQLLNESNGIQTANINVLTRDRYGFLWVLSNRTVQRYDGQNAHRIEVKDDELLDIAVDSTNRVWVSSQSGIKQYISDHRGFANVAIKGAAGARFNKLYVASGNRVWAMSTAGLYLYNEKANAFEPYVIKGLESSRFDRRLLHGYGNLLFFTDGPLVYILNTITGNLTKIPFKDARNITALSEDIVWLSNWSLQSFELTISTGTIKPFDASRFGHGLSSPFILIKNAFRLSKDEYFVSLNHGCYTYNVHDRMFRKRALYHSGMRLHDDENAFPSFLDHERTFWMILDEGIVFFKPHVHTIGWLRSPGVGHYGWNNDVRAITEDGNGNIWLATLNGFTRLDLANGQSKSYRPFSAYSGYSFPSVRGLAYDGRNLIVGPTHGGLLIFDPETEKFRKPVITGGHKDSLQKILETDFISNIHPRKNGQYLVLAKNATWLVYDRDYKIKPIDLPWYAANTLAAAEDGKGNTWIASYEGLIYTDDSFRVLAMDTSFAPGRMVGSLLLKNDSTVLAGSVGLFEVTASDGKLTKKKFIPELENQRIHTLYQDQLGKYWIGADNGLYRYTMSTGKLEWFDVADNVQNKRFNPNSIFRSSSNNYLFLGGFNGVNYFVPEKITSRAEKLTVIISSIRVDEDDSSFVAATLPWEIRHFHSLEFQFTTPYFHNPQKVQYRYRLQGLDSGWVYNGRNNIVRFSALRPGNYTFRAAASLDGINWFEARQAYAFTIMPAFWQTAWFVGLCLLVLALITYFLLRAYRARLQRREMQKMVDYFALSGHDHATVDDILWDIARNCISRLDFEDCVIYLLDEERNMLVQKAAYGIKNPSEREIFNPIEIAVGKGIVGSVAETRKPELISDTSKDPRYIVDDARRLSELAVPIVYGEKVLGVIDSEHRKKNFYKKEHKDVLLSVASICSAKIAKVVAQQASLEKEKRMKELDLLMKESRLAVLQSQMNPHFIFNAMNSIQRFTLQHDVENANKYISRFSRLLRMVLQHSEKNSITLEDELQMLQLYLEIESLRMSNAFSFRFEVEDDIEADALKIPGMMVQPFVENALAHGLANKPGDKSLLVRFYMPHERLLLCEVTDNGIGREKARIVKEKKAALMPHQSKGINLVQERLSLYNRKVSGKISIIDLTDEAGEAAGTTVKIEIPVM